MRPEFETRWGREGGFTQVEMMISIVVLVIVLGGVYSLFFTGMDTYAIGQTQADLERQAKKVISRIAEDLSLSGQATTSPIPVVPFPSDEVTFQLSEGLVEGALTWSSPITIQLLRTAEDPWDGIDNDGNGLIDEGVIVRRRNVGGTDEAVEVLTRWVSSYLEGEVKNNVDDNGNGLVDERGLALVQEDGLWTIHLTLQKRDANGRLLTHTISTSVRQRN